MYMPPTFLGIWHVYTEDHFIEQEASSVSVTKGSNLDKYYIANQILGSVHMGCLTWHCNSI